MWVNSFNFIEKTPRTKDINYLILGAQNTPVINDKSGTKGSAFENYGSDIRTYAVGCSVEASFLRYMIPMGTMTQ